MRKILIVLVVLLVLLSSSASLAFHRPITKRISGDPDEFQAQSTHDESGMTMRPSTGDGKANLRSVPRAEYRGLAKRPEGRSLIHILWENLLLGKTTHR